MRKRSPILPLLLLLALLLIFGAQILSDRAIYGQVIRLHVLAPSDAEEDQALKYRVRDLLLEQTTPLLAGCASKEEAEERLLLALPELLDGINRHLEQENSPYTATATLLREAYPTRSYGGFSLPRGSYTSLRILLGEGEGANWWCVLYPSFCLSAATDETEDAFLAAGFTPDQIALLTEQKKGGYVIRFRILEWIASLFDRGE